MKKLVTLAGLALALTGCVTNKGWQGLIPDKDVEIIKPESQLATPWGTQFFKAERIATRLRGSTNELPTLQPK